MPTETTTSSPRPWRVIHEGFGPIIIDADGGIVARVDWGRGDLDEANAALIVKEVNNAR